MKKILFIAVLILYVTLGFGQTFNLANLQKLLTRSPSALEKILVKDKYLVFKKRDFKDFIIAQYVYFDQTTHYQTIAIEIYYHRNTIFQVEYETKSKAEYNQWLRSLSRQGFKYVKSEYDKMKLKNIYYQRGKEQVRLKPYEGRFASYTISIINIRGRKLYGKNIPEFH